jgi:hypothetical protein
VLISCVVLIFTSLVKVSRTFYHLTHHRPIWVNAYTTCPILLPPGPFSYQSTVDLELALKKSHLFQANWTSPFPCPVSRQTFAIKTGLNRIKLMGRYLLTAGQPMFRCYDLESKNEESTAIAVYNSTEFVFDCVVEKYSAMDSGECELLCALKSQARGDERLAAV